MLNVNIEIIDGNKYYSAEDNRGNLTTVYDWGQGAVVMVNCSPAIYAAEAKRLSKTAKALIEFMEADKTEEAIEIAKEEKAPTNPRYIAFVEAHGKQPNYEFMAFINRMKTMFCGDIYGRVNDHDEFTKFIFNNAHKYTVGA